MGALLLMGSYPHRASVSSVTPAEYRKRFATQISGT